MAAIKLFITLLSKISIPLQINKKNNAQHKIINPRNFGTAPSFGYQRTIANREYVIFRAD